ncbi:RNA polymerase subunit sigma [Mesorhizobium loti]|nr:RNA polymerase sigma factor [Mesorhizobium loti]PLP57216.1 RNA polymerase subunit sigma [Mesorhizobium loti]
MQSARSVLMPASAASDVDLVRGALAREATAFRAIMTRYNQRLYRLARSILRNDTEAEDVVQEAYLRAFANLAGFRGDSSLATWLSRIVINEALGRLRKTRRAEMVPLPAEEAGAARIIPFPFNASPGDPERNMAQREILRFVEQATDSLPETFRLVFVARVIEGLSVEETADLLDIRPETVKTRLHRARKLLRARLDAQIGPVLLGAFPFAGHRCERMTEVMMKRLAFPG